VRRGAADRLAAAAESSACGRGKTVGLTSIVDTADWGCFVVGRAALLWTAPELMASQQAAVVGLSTGTQKGDVYSFGIVVHEILYRAGLFRCADDELAMPAKSTSLDM